MLLAWRPSLARKIASKAAIIAKAKLKSCLKKF
jgi:hypothetical protein